MRAILIALTLIVLSAPAIAAAEERIPENRTQIQLTFAPLVREVAPAVVNIYAKKTVTERSGFGPLFNDPFFKRFFGDRFDFGQPRERVQNSLGSGVIVDEDGVVVTNHHVIAGADEVRVVLNDRREFDAEILLSDERTDIAVVKLLEADRDIPHVEFGDSDSLAVGDLVLAIGNPFGVGQTVTSGIVSGLARTSVGISDYQSFIQTDAAINPGNSGGALVGMNGKIVGINTAIFSRSGGSNGIGFAVPANMARAVVESAVEGRPLVRPWIGFAGRDVDVDMANALELETPHGVIVEEIREDGPADEAGLKPGDVIMTIDGKPIGDAQNLRFRLATKGVGETVELGYIRDGESDATQFTLVAPPEEPPRDPVTVQSGAPLAGATFMNLSPALSQEIGMPTDRTGVVIFKVARNSPASRYGMKPGDILLEINGWPIPSTERLREILRNADGGWRILIDRDGKRLSLRVR